MKNLNAVLWVVIIFQPLFALFVFPALTSSSDSDIFHQIRDDVVRKTVVTYHRKNQRLAQTALCVFSVTGLALAGLAHVQTKKKMKP